MKTIRYIFGIGLLFLFLGYGCKRDKMESYAVEKVHPHPDSLLAQFTNIVKKGSSGWHATLIPKSGGIYSLFFKLDPSGKLLNMIDLDDNSAKKAKEGSYTLTATANQAVLSFSEGTYLDVITHKEGFRTMSADTSYSFRYASADTIVLLGNRNGDELKLVNIPAAQIQSYESGLLSHSLTSLSEYMEQKNFHSFHLSGVGDIELSIDSANRTAFFFYGVNGLPKMETNQFYYGINQVLLKYPTRIGSHLIKGFSYNPTQKTYAVLSNGANLDLRGTNSPTVPLHLLLGNGLAPYVSLPSPKLIQALPNWSTDFGAIFEESSQKLSTIGAGFLMLSFAFNIETQQMSLNVLFSLSGNVYQGSYPHSYTKTKDGVYKFTALPLNPLIVVQGNANIIKAHMEPVLALVKTDQFSLTTFEVGTAFLAQMTSIERPNIYFTGYPLSPDDIL
ncbi:DUF4302 domain-containing protein [Sphingobacterium humi]|uniref:DUF4302 domain-containing protein n=1 Tax=Sphingobacterium humi TaxID=1796905 RepID=A0A6N8L312_9SPHI|nr:DUF4302 domain-containing protein [Sphingobacterium humi]MVZ63419.1 DUF4302 domain-containing protein [Sphingobacterium humi]